MMQELPTYTEVSQILAQSHSVSTASELHGMVCAIICAGLKHETKAKWIEAILSLTTDADAASAQNGELVADIYQISSTSMQGLEFDFELLLPDDDNALSERARALSLWCHGFLIGWEISGKKDKLRLSSDSQEALAHFKEISKLDYNAISVNNEDEWAFSEVTEFVRMGVLTIYSDLMASGSGSHFMVPDSKHLH